MTTTIQKKITSAGSAVRILLATLLLCIGAAYISPAPAATLLPLAEQTFDDANGNPLTGGTVQFYVPGTTTPKDTWQDAAGTILNTNPVVLNSAGRAIIYGSGSYRQVVKDSLGNTIWDQVTTDTAPSTGIAWGGTSTGTANAQAVTASSFSATAGSKLLFIANLTNTGAFTINPNGSGAISVVKPSLVGSVALSGGEVSAGNLIELDYDGTQLNLVNGVGTPVAGVLTTIPSAATTDIGTIASHNVDITGTTGITSFGSSASVSFPLYFVKFEGALTLTYNAASMILPGSANITTAAGDTALAEYLGSGNWRVRQYSRATSKPILLPISLVNVQVFTSGSGTYTPTAGATRGYVIVTGGGGGGGGSGTTDDAGGGGGGAGATAQTFVSSLASVSYTVGAAGLAGAAAAGTGGTGGQSIFGTITANGGTGGTGANSTSGGSSVAGGAGSATTANATFTTAGSAGTYGYTSNSAGVGVDWSGAGGASFWGLGGAGIAITQAPGANAGVAPGSGGGGAMRVGSNQAGGVGAAGIIVVYEYGY